MMNLQVFTLLAVLVVSCSAFAPIHPSSSRAPQTVGIGSLNPSDLVVQHQHNSLQRQRKSVASVQTMGLFGLGAPEIGVILVAAAFLLGPDKLASLGKDAGKIAGELKEVPKEFQRGMEEGEAQAQAIKAKSESPVKDAETSSSE
eukprot:CAMPEP_0113483966 /NCGR_PEP_ID=MMETSP0014_2-20120614/23710_1 /TAXON_ID=2857 /ORGANISM="Nitzschia sp." /LENGTH=144 /DNA_ID=CAMNT_0000377537 /DNA_START=136 /DNA_END=570 /DNA_ORIENTATION=+ /assembly_acc=CAM_ASM_000159